ncbi:MAG: hypothetical protein FJZ58_02875 [Chlamydiae bacterium]|nr:hypothetical protein [Chlamydiota bacterium]
MGSSCIVHQGVIVAASHHIEWMLPWWWYHYTLHNTLPVAFFDLGISSQAKAWCKGRGELLSPSIPSTLDPKKEDVSPPLAATWEQLIGSGVWDIRKHWFKKPFLFQTSPFAYTLWIDLDCEVRSCIEPLFSYVQPPLYLALAQEPALLQEGLRALKLLAQSEVLYNSGVISYHKDSPLLSLWVQEVLTCHHKHIGDQEALSHRLFLQGYIPSEIPSTYNWDRGLGPNPEAHIFHWHGQKGKTLIREQINQLSRLPFMQMSFCL